MLLRLDHEGVKKLIDGMSKEVELIKAHALKQSWYMRGSLSYTDALNLSADERVLVNKLIEENIETTKKTQLPFI